MRKTIQGKLFSGKPVEVHMAGDSPKQQLAAKDYDFKCLFVTGLAAEATKNDMRELFPAASRIAFRTNNDKRSVGHCFVFFLSEVAAMAGLEDVQHRQVRGQGVSITFSKIKDTLKLKEKPAPATAKVVAATPVVAAAQEPVRGRKRTASSDEVAATADSKPAGASAKKGRPSAVQPIAAEPAVKLSVKRKASELSDDDAAVATPKSKGKGKPGSSVVTPASNGKKAPAAAARQGSAKKRKSVAAAK